MGSIINLVGKTFGRLKVIGYKGNSIWVCQCSCGNIKDIHGYSLRTNKTLSCGCLRKEKTSENKIENILNKQFGDWEVIEYSGNSMWKCKCSCGTIRDVKAQSLKSGKSTSCGHDTTGFKDLIGQTINGWDIIKYLGNALYECKCSICGEIKIQRAYNITKGLSGVCSCSRKSSKIIDLTGMQFGELTVIEYIGNNQWKSLCSCGNTSINFSHNLRRSDSISCGCKELHKYSIDDIVDMLLQFEQTNHRKPYRFEMEELLGRSKTSVERYIQEYNLYEYINRHSKSRGEEDILKMYPTPLVNCRHILPDSKELDLVYTNSNIAIEFNGVYWHSTQFKTKNYHKDKTIACAKQGIHLIHIFEYEWNIETTKRKIIEYLSLILKPSDNRVIQGRKTKIHKISNSVAVEFCNKYHLQNGVTSDINLGIYHEQSLVGVMTFGRPRYADEFEFELLRMCFIPKTIVIGGASKMFKQFVREYSPKSVITYCDITKFKGNSYINMGFKFDTLTVPNYVWCNSKYETLTRYQTQKHKLIEKGLCDLDETEDDVMKSLGFYKIYNSGNIRFVWYNETKQDNIELNK